MVDKIKLAPSILSANFSRLGDEVKVVEEGGADMIHIDVMDGHFVPNITIGPVAVKAIKKSSKLPLDVHLMIEEPADYISDFVSAGADWISVHLEASKHLHRLIQQLKIANVKAGVAVNPATPVNLLDGVLDELDFVVIMSVNPGFGGQDFIEKSLDKISELKQIISKRGLSVEIEVDGGITKNNALSVAMAGANILVAGAAVFGTSDPRLALQDIRKALILSDAVK